MSGQLVDATLVAAPKQRTTRAEKQATKAGRVPEEWRDKPAKLRQKDRDARWTVKTTKARRRAGETPKVDPAIPAFGYQNHISADRRHRLIRRWRVTDAAAHAGARLADLLDPGNTASGVWADSGYRSQKNEDLLRQRMLKSHIHRKKPAKRPMPERTARANAKKSAVRAPFAHVFEQKHRMDLFVRPRPGDDQDRPCQPRQQPAPPALAGAAAGCRLTRSGSHPGAAPSAPRTASEPAILYR